MEDKAHFTLEGSGTTVAHPLALALLFVCIGLVIFLPRKYAVLPFVVLLCFVSARQCISVFGVNLFFVRILALCGLARSLMRGEFARVNFKAIDLCVLGYAVAYFLAGALNFGFAASVLKMRIGGVVEIFGFYMLLRAMIRSKEDVDALAHGLSLLVIPVMFFFLIELSTGYNVFSIFGGVAEYAMVREGKVRCQGAFGHPILAGTFWSALLPILVYNAINRGWKRPLSLFSCLACCVIVVTTASSTSLMGLVAAFGGLMSYPFRRYTRVALYSTLVALVILHFSMDAPVWHLIARLDVTGGNSAYHRFVLIDGFITHFNEWWLLGTRIGTEHWGHFSFDISNQYVSVGVQGGLISLLFFLASILLAFRAAGKVVKEYSVLGWAIGTSLAVYCVCFLGISIWGQLLFSWALTVAIAASLSESVEKQRRVHSEDFFDEDECYDEEDMEHAFIDAGHGDLEE